MVSSMAVPARMAQPAVGAGLRRGPARAGRSTTAGRCARSCRPKGCGRCTTRTSAASSRPRHEIVRLLDDLGPDVLGFGPDTGHLRWAGIEPAPFIRRYADRMGGIHIKDCFPDYLSPESRAGMSYHEVAATKRLWAEPGSGVVDFDAVVAADPRRLRRRLHDRGGRAERGVATWSRTASRSSGRGATFRRRSHDGDGRRAGGPPSGSAGRTGRWGRRRSTGSSRSSSRASTPTGAASACWCRTAPGRSRCRCSSGRSHRALHGRASRLTVLVALGTHAR